MPTDISRETLRTMIEAFGGLPMTDDELEAILPNVQAYAERAKRFIELYLANILSTRMLRVQEGERHAR